MEYSSLVKDLGHHFRNWAYTRKCKVNSCASCTCTIVFCSRSGLWRKHHSTMSTKAFWLLWNVGVHSHSHGDHRSTSFFLEWWVAQNKTLYPGSDCYSGTLVQQNMDQMHLSIGIPSLSQAFINGDQVSRLLGGGPWMWGASAETGLGDRGCKHMQPEW